MTRTLNHVPDEIDAMYETVAEDKDVVLVHVLVLSLEEPRASGGVNSAFISFSFIKINLSCVMFKCLIAKIRKKLDQ